MPDLLQVAESSSEYLVMRLVTQRHLKSWRVARLRIVCQWICQGRARMPCFSAV